MKKYKILLTKNARKSLDKISSNFANPILDAIEKLENNPRPKGYKKLTNKVCYRIRVGDYRVLYEISDKILIVEVFEVGHRKDVYM
jgi:mRNA interferase RelE/StbE